MRIITSQMFRDDAIIEKKKNELISYGATSVTLPVVPVYIDDLYILVDGHHTYSAAKELGIDVIFDVVDDEKSYYKDLEDENSEGILDAHYMDGDWRYLDTNKLVF